MSEVLVGKVARATESRHATGAEKEIPDIREYSRAPPATSSDGTRTPARSPGGAGRSCSASPPTNWPT